MTLNTVPPREGQTLADARAQIAAELNDLLGDLEELHTELMEAHYRCRFTSYFEQVKARYALCLVAVDSLQLASFKMDPPAFLTRSVK